jgi:hypothetical protein
MSVCHQVIGTADPAPPRPWAEGSFPPLRGLWFSTVNELDPFRPERPQGPEAPSFGPPVDVAVPYAGPDEVRRPGQPLAWGGVLIAVLLVVGAFGPWVTFGPFNVAGVGSDVDGTPRDGVIVLGLAVLYGATIGAYLWSRKLWKALVSVALGLVTLIVGIADVADVGSRDIDGYFGNSLSVGWGLWLCTIGGAAAAGLGVVLSVLSRR